VAEARSTWREFLTRDNVLWLALGAVLGQVVFTMALGVPIALGAALIALDAPGALAVLPALLGLVSLFGAGFAIARWSIFPRAGFYGVNLALVVAMARALLTSAGSLYAGLMTIAFLVSVAAALNLGYWRGLRRAKADSLPPPSDAVDEPYRTSAST